MNSKVNIKPENLHWIVDKEKRKVVCYMEGTEDMFINFVYDNSDVLSVLVYKNLFEGNPSEFKMNNRFVGIATCAPEDEWDENYGRLLAYHRLRNKISASFFKRGNTFANYVDKHLDRFLSTINDYGAKLYKNSVRREKILALNDEEGMEEEE